MRQTVACVSPIFDPMNAHKKPTVRKLHSFPRHPFFSRAVANLVEKRKKYGRPWCKYSFKGCSWGMRAALLCRSAEWELGCCRFLVRPDARYTFSTPSAPPSLLPSNPLGAVINIALTRKGEHAMRTNILHMHAEFLSRIWMCAAAAVGCKVRYLFLVYCLRCAQPPLDNLHSKR